MRAPCQPRVVLVITCHDLGRHLGCYGIDTVSSPNLDALAQQGVRFDRAFCAAPQCSPSRAALATGRYPHSNGVMGLAHGSFGWDLHLQERHVASLFAGHGYDTRLFGLQHVTPDPRRLGFAHRHGEGTAEQVSDEFSRWCSDARPSACYVEINFFEPHRPYDRGGVDADESLRVHIPPYLPQGDASRREMAALQGSIAKLDRNVGRILAALDDARLTEDALVVFTADHGIAMPRAKCTLYDPGIEIALLVRWPAGGLGAATPAELVGNVDILPTLLESAGIPAPADLQGRSFLPLLRGDEHEPRTAIYAEKTFHSYYDPMRAIRTERFKLIRNFESAFSVEVPADVQAGDIFRSSTHLYSTDRSDAVELYDLTSDPLESNNLVAGEDVVANVGDGLDDLLLEWMEVTGDPLLEGPIQSPHYRRLR